MDSYLQARDGKINAYVGKDAVSAFRGLVLASALRLYAKTKILTTRGVSARAMRLHATAITGKPYKRGQEAQAADDVQKWAEEMKAALPVGAAPLVEIRRAP